MSNRIQRRFEALRESNRAGFIAYVSGGDPDLETFGELLGGLPSAGADLIEIGVPFTDPAADGPAIQASGQRALKAGASMKRILAAIEQFRESDADTPVILMGYYNPIHEYGVEDFARDAAKAGVDGLITVDLPPEEEDELRPFVQAAGLDIVRLIAPTTDDRRLPTVLQNASGFVYYVSITGITGTRSPTEEAVTAAMERLRRFTDLPLAVGFGIRTPDQAAAVGRVADASVVGSAIVSCIADNLDDEGKAKPGLIENVLALVGQLADGAHNGRDTAS